jgi:sugar lactone lactonase YvrE
MADTNKVLRIDPSPGACTVVKQLRATSLDNMVFDAKGRLLVSDAYNGKIYRIAPGGGVRTLTRGGLMLPGGIALMRDGAGRERLYVADMWRVMKYRLPSGTFAGSEVFSHLGGSIVQAWAVAPDDGKLILASWMANAVQEWDPVAHAQVAIHTDFAMPINAIRFQGDIVAAEIATGTVARKDAETGVKTTIASGLLLPTGLAAIADDLYVADWADGSVLQIVDEGLPLVTPRLVAEGLTGPEGMAVNARGKLLVVESGTGTLTRIDPETGTVDPLVTGLKLGLGVEPGAGPPCWSLSSVAVGKGGLMYVTGDVADVIYRVKKVPVAQ